MVMVMSMRAAKMAMAPEMYEESLWKVKVPVIGCNAKGLSAHLIEVSSRASYTWPVSIWLGANCWRGEFLTHDVSCTGRIG
jgi:hypothetical protein